MFKVKWLSVLALIIAVILAITLIPGCRKVTPATTTAAETTAAETTTAETVKTISPDQLKLAFVIHIAIPFTDAIRRGAEAAAKDYGVSIDVVAPSKYDVMEQISLFEAEIAKGVQGICTVAADAKAWEVPTNNAIDKGILVYHANVGSPASKVDGIVGISGYQDGLILGDAMFKLPEVQALGLGSDVKVVVTECDPSLAVLQGRGNGVMDVMKEKAPNWKVLGPFTEGMSNEAAYTFYETQFTATPDVAIMISSCAFGVPAMTRHKQKTPAAKYIVVGYDLEPDALNGIKDGIASLTLGQRPFLQGYLPVMAMCEYFLKGNPLAKGWISPGNDVVNKDNVVDVIARETDPAKEYDFYKQVIASEFTPLWEKGKPYSEFNETGR